MVYEKKEINFQILDNLNCKIIEKIQNDKYTRNWNENAIKHLLKKGGGEGLIIHKNHEPIGYCLLRNLIDEVEILSFEIIANYRHMGFGLALFNQIEGSFEKKKISRCIIEVNKNNILARGFYEKIGFVCIKTIKNYYKIGNSYQDGLLLQKIYI